MAIHTPANSAALAAIVIGNGDTVLLQSGVTYSAASVPATLLAADNLTIGVTGTGSPPVISGGEVQTNWTYDATNNVYSSPAYPGNTLGNITEDGVPMRFVQWNADIGTTVQDSRMTTGVNLPYWAGSFSYDPVGLKVYIRPSSGTPAEHQYIVSKDLNGFDNSSTRRGLWIDGIDFKHISRHGIDLKNKTKVKISHCGFHVIGGIKPVSLWLGNGIELSRGVWGAEVSDCVFNHIFDSCGTSQLYEGTPASCGDHLWARLTALGPRMSVIEVSAHTTNQLITDIEIVDINCTGQGHGWAYYNNGGIITNTVTAANSTSRILRSFARNVTGNTQRRLYIGLQHGGVCGIEDSVGVGSTLQAPRSDQAAGFPGQVDLIRNVTDNLGAPVGANWVTSTARMSNVFRGSLL